MLLMAMQSLVTLILQMVTGYQEPVLDRDLRLHCQRISRRAFVLGDSALGKLGRIETKPFGMALCRVVRAGCLDHGSPWITYEMQIKRPDRPAVERYRVGWW